MKEGYISCLARPEGGVLVGAAHISGALHFGTFWNRKQSLKPQNYK